MYIYIYIHIYIYISLVCLSNRINPRPTSVAFCSSAILLSLFTVKLSLAQTVNLY